MTSAVVCRRLSLPKAMPWEMRSKMQWKLCRRPGGLLYGAGGTTITGAECTGGGAAVAGGGSGATGGGCGCGCEPLYVATLPWIPTSPSPRPFRPPGTHETGYLKAESMGIPRFLTHHQRSILNVHLLNQLLPISSHIIREKTVVSSVAQALFSLSMSSPFL